MSALFYLIPVSLFLGIIALIAFHWTLRNRQYEDPEGDRFRVLGDDDKPLSRN